VTDERIDRKAILITDASSGSTRPVRLFAAKGWKVAATTRDPAQGAEFKVLEYVLVTRLDVQDQASIGSALQLAVDRFGGRAVVVTSAL